MKLLELYKYVKIIRSIFVFLQQKYCFIKFAPHLIKCRLVSDIIMAKSTYFAKLDVAAKTVMI